MHGWLALWLAVSPSLEDAQRAERLAAQAVSLHAEGDLDAASDALVEAFRIYPDQNYLFMRGMIEREAGDCEEAIALFEAFIAAHPPAVDVEAAQAQRDACADTLEAKVEPAPRPSADPKVEPVAAPVPRVAPPPLARDLGTDPVPDRRPSRDPLAGTLLGVGLGTSIFGAGLLGGAAARAHRAPDADTAGEYRRSMSVARGLGAAGVAALGVGASLLLGSVVRYALLARKARNRALD